MPSASTDQVIAATKQWLKPVVHVLLRGGVTWREFSTLAKSVYVEVATAKFGKRGRATNVSRTAVLTGLTRREVRNQRGKLHDAPEAATGYVTKGCLILAAWHLDPQFLDASGKPAQLPVKGPGSTFEALVKNCGGDVPASTLLKELRTAGALRVLPDGRLEPLQRNYIPHAIDGELIRLWGTVLADVAVTYVHNLTRTSKKRARFERQAVNDRVAASALPQFRDFLNREGQAFLERLDAWLTEHEVKDDNSEPGRTSIRLGAGVYHIQD